MRLNLHSRGIKAYFFDVGFFDELAEDDEIDPSRPRDVPLLEWEALKGQKQILNKNPQHLLILLGPRNKCSLTNIG